MTRAKHKRSLRFGSAEQMPEGMRALYEQQQAVAASPAQQPGWVPGTTAEQSSASRRGSKYAAKRTEVDGMLFDSKAEASYYLRLKARVLAGEVSYFLRQVAFHLPGKTRYVCDFAEVLADGRIRYVDVKGMQTEVFRLKKRQVEALYPVTIEIEK